MFELFTAGARAALLEAQAEARDLGHDRIGSEHVLIGLLRLPASDTPGNPAPNEEADVGRSVLADCGITLDRVRAEIQSVARAEAWDLTEADTDALRAIGIDVDEVRRRVEETFGSGALDTPATAGRWSSTAPRAMRPEFTSSAKHVFEVAVRESIRLGHRHIGTEHVLLALASEGLAAEMLRTLGAEPDRVRDHVLEQLGLAA